MIHNAPANDKEPHERQGLYAGFVWNSSQTPGYFIAREPFSVPFSACVQRDLSGDASRVFDAAARRAGEDAFGERASQRHRSVLRGGVFERGELQRFVCPPGRAVALGVPALCEVERGGSAGGSAAFHSIVLFLDDPRITAIFEKPTHTSDAIFPV